MNARSKACILSVAGPDLLEEERALFSEHRPWGVILMGRSCVSRKQVRRLVADIWDSVGRACLIFIDQEGGRVARLKAPEWPEFPSGGVYSTLYDEDPDLGIEAIRLGYRLMAAELTNISIHADCAPVADLPVLGAHDIIGDRALGTTPEKVAILASAALEGLSAGGVAGVIKHIPGHGRSTADSHLELPRVTAGDNELSKDLNAFQRLVHAPMAMTAHLAYDAFDPGIAATLSSKVIGRVIRERIGFDGLLMSDDLGMKALGGSLTERTHAALGAGCDVVLHCAGFATEPSEVLNEMTEIAEATPLLEGRALQRAEAADACAGPGDDFDTQAGWERFHTLLAKVAVS